MAERQDDHSATKPAADLAGLRCPKCDYDLTGLSRTQCPECGHLFDPAFLLAIAREQRERPNRERTRRGVKVLFKVAGGLLVIQSVGYVSVLMGLFHFVSPTIYYSIVLVVFTLGPSILQPICLIHAWKYCDVADLTGDRKTFMKACVAGAMSLFGVVLLFLTYVTAFTF